MTRSIRVIMVLAVFVLFVPVLSNAGEVNLPKTGQTTCYDENGNVIDCAGTGQDGDVQAGVEWPQPRFEDNGNGTITDHLTGLIWLKNADCFGIKTWSEAVAACNNLASGSCGLSDGSVAGDWRLPNILELESLVNSETATPSVWLNSQGFINVQTSYYWSATTTACYTDYAWMVNFYTGYVGYFMKSVEIFFWPVHAGQ